MGVQWIREGTNMAGPCYRVATHTSGHLGVRLTTTQARCYRQRVNMASARDALAAAEWALTRKWRHLTVDGKRLALQLSYNYIILRLDNHVPSTFEENERIEDDINDDDEELCYEDVVNICEQEPNIEKISVANSQTNENVVSNSQIEPHRRRAKKVQRNRK